MTVKEHFSIFKRSVAYLYHLEKTYTLTLAASSAISAVLPYISIYMSAMILDELVLGRRIPYLIIYVAITIGLTFILRLANSLLSKVRDYHKAFLNYNESKVFVEKTMALDYEDIEDNRVHMLREKIKAESRNGRNLGQLYQCFGEMVRWGASIVTSAAITISIFSSPAISWKVKLGFFLLVLLIGGINFWLNIQEEKIQMHYIERCIPYNSFADYIFAYLSDYKSGMEVRMFGMEQSVSQLLQKFMRETDKLELEQSKKQLWTDFLGNLMVHVLQFAAYFVVIVGVVAGGFSIGTIAKYGTICMMVWAVQEMIRATQRLFHNNQYLKTYFSYLDIPSKMYQGTLPVEKRAFCDHRDMDYEIEFRNVSFRYPGAKMYALRNVSLKVKVGQRMAVVGMNGSGKTTFIKLLCRLYDPTEGEIFLNGINIKKYNYEEYLSIFSVVFQDFKLFSFTVGQNVAATVEYDEEKVKTCLERAGLGECLQEWPKGLDTCLYKDFDAGGVEVSGGEAQKIALARALYKDAPFIILDEPTAALDPIAEAEIYSKFNEIVDDKTAIYISHRLSSCKFCDEIVVFHEGMLVQRGSHEKLVADQSGKYYELWNAQAQYYTDKCTC